MSRIIDKIVIHCSATKPSQDFGYQHIYKMHINRGFSDIGYHYIIKRDGELQPGRDENKPGAHVAGHNLNSIGICLIGGVNEKMKAENNFTEAQWATLEPLVANLLTNHPHAEVLGHRDFPGVKKDCPCFDVRSWWAGVQKKRIEQRMDVL